MKEDLDLFDSPGPYQVCSGITNGPPKHQLHTGLVPGNLITDKNMYVLEFVGIKLYIRKRWWGRIQTTTDIKLATKWNSRDEAREWALKRKLDVY